MLGLVIVMVAARSCPPTCRNGIRSSVAFHSHNDIRPWIM